MRCPISAFTLPGKLQPEDPIQETKQKVKHELASSSAVYTCMSNAPSPLKMVVNDKQLPVDWIRYFSDWFDTRGNAADVTERRPLTPSEEMHVAQGLLAHLSSAASGVQLLSFGLL